MDDLSERLSAWGKWCHDRNLKAELQKDLYSAADRIRELENVIKHAIHLNLNRKHSEAQRTLYAAIGESDGPIQPPQRRQPG